MKLRGRAGPLSVELLVVVLGVLIALAAESWWGERADRERVAGYLRALEADLTEAAVDLDRVHATYQGYFRDVAAFNEALDGPAPPADDVVVPWHTLGGGDRFFLPLGMIDALLTTGDINLLPATLRLAVIREHAELKEREAQFQRFNDLLVASIRDLDLPARELQVAGTFGEEAFSARQMYRNARMRHAWYTIATVFGNQATEVGAMSESARSLIDAIRESSR